MFPDIGSQVPTHNHKFSKWLGRFLLKICGWRFEGNLPDRPKLVLVAAPHTSNWDAFFGFAAILGLGIKISWMAKHSLFKWPFKRAMIALGGIPINRTASHGVVEQFINEFEKRKQLLLAVTPEGTRTRVDKWKTGFYFIAQKAEAPIVTGFLDYARKRIGFGPVLEPTGDVIADLKVLQRYYATIAAKHPEKFNSRFV